MKNSHQRRIATSSLQDDEIDCQELFKQLCENDEHPRIEAKLASEVSSSVMETICAYSNEPGMDGGFLLLGVKAARDPMGPRYSVIGLSNPDKIQRDIATQCASRFNVVVRPEFLPDRLEGKIVVGVHVREAQPGDKPVFFKKVGLPDGAYRRFGTTTQKCTEEDLTELFHERQSRSFDRMIIDGATFADLDEEAIGEYRRARAEVAPDAEELNWNDGDLLESLNCVERRQGVLFPNVAGLLLFGSRKALRKYFPMIRLDYIRISGREWIDDPDHPLETIEMRDPLFRLIPRGQAAIMDDIPRAFSFTSGMMQRQETPRIDPRVIREALVNALMHRNYRIHGPVQVIRYANRIEIRNPGYSLVPIDQLGQPGSKTRNPVIANVLHETNYAETKGSGIKVMRRLMKEANLSLPTFESSREGDRFTATLLFHHFLDDEDITWLEHFRDANLSADEARILIHARESGSVSNSICREYTGLDTLGASNTLKKLRSHGLLQQHAHSSAPYYTPTDRLLPPEEDVTLRNGGNGTPVQQHQPTLADFDTPGHAVIRGSTSEIDRKMTLIDEKSDMIIKKSDMIDEKSDMIGEMSDMIIEKSGMIGEKSDMIGQISDMIQGVSSDLLEEILQVGKHRPPAYMQQLVRRLCAIRPFSADELAQVLNRTPRHVSEYYLSPMLRDGVLEFTIPEKRTDRRQAYRIRELER